MDRISSGIIRRIDDLGRVVIPKEVRRAVRIHEGDPLEIFSTPEGILLKKYVPEEDRKKVIIHVRGGVAELVSGPDGVEVEITDFDNED